MVFWLTSGAFFVGALVFAYVYRVDAKPACGSFAPGAVHCLLYVSPSWRDRHASLRPTTNFTPQDLQAAYGLTAYSASRGKGRVVAVIEAGDDPTLEKDLGVFRSFYGLPPCTIANQCLRKVGQTGSAGSLPAINALWAQETSIDTQMVSSICPRCDILVVEANGENMRDLAASVNTAVRLGAFSVSNSYSANENGHPGEYKEFASSYDHPGVPIVAAAGDEGFSAGAQVPAAYPNVIAVGGTTLPRGGQETVWSGMTSGCSALFPKPSWQRDTGCAMRTIADIAFDADPATSIQTYDSTPAARSGVGWAAGGGTSYGSPAIAAIYALAGFKASNAASLYVPGQLHDITSGSDGAVDAFGLCMRPDWEGGAGPGLPSYFCVARKGYDAPSGNGSPRGLCGFGIHCARSDGSR